MSALAAFIGAAGTWRATCALRDPANDLSCDAESRATVTPAAPPGPDWGWRTRLSAAPGTLSMVMFNVTPDGHEELAVDAQYRPA